MDKPKLHCECEEICELLVIPLILSRYHDPNKTGILVYPSFQKLSFTTVALVLGNWNGQDEVKGGSFTKLTLNRNLPTMRLNQTLDDCQP